MSEILFDRKGVFRGCVTSYPFLQKVCCISLPSLHRLSMSINGIYASMSIYVSMSVNDIKVRVFSEYGRDTHWIRVEIEEDWVSERSSIWYHGCTVRQSTRVIGKGRSRNFVGTDRSIFWGSVRRERRWTLMDWFKIVTYLLHNRPWGFIWEILSSLYIGKE